MTESLDVVRSLLTAHEGKDVLPPIRDVLQRIGPDPKETAVSAALADDPGWSHYSSGIVWDMTATGMGGVSRGTRELAQWWAVWVPAWEEHVYTVRKYDEVGGWVLTVSDVEATSRGSHQAKTTVSQIWQVQDGKVSVMRAFMSEDEARKAAGA